MTQIYDHILRPAVEKVRSIKRQLADFSGDCRGLSAVEFALLAPLMLSLYFGVVEVSQGIAADRKVTLTARSIADLISQVTSVKDADITNSLNAASAVMSPYLSVNLKVTVSSVVIDANGKATIDWSKTFQGAARATGSTVNVPTALNIPNSSLIWAEVQYDFKPTIGYVLTGTLALQDQIYMRPRLSDRVTYSPT
jgi:Flp pilus assembly protein TadG